MTGTDVPEDGELQIGSVLLPAGRRIRSNGGLGEPVAWVTSEPMPGAGRVWAALSDVHAQPGLAPFLLSGIAGGTERPWDSQEFRDPEDVTGLDHLDAAELLREDWLRQTTEYDDYDEEDEEYQDDDFARSIAEDVAPFSRRQFPGLAKAEDHQLDAGQFDRVLSGLGPARVGLVPAGRPADALPMLGLERSTCHRAAFRRRAALLGGPLRCPAPAGRLRRHQRPGAATAAHPGVSSAPGRRAVGVLQRMRQRGPPRRPPHHGEPDELTHLDLLVGLSIAPVHSPVGSPAGVPSPSPAPPGKVHQTDNHRTKRHPQTRFSETSGPELSH